MDYKAIVERAVKTFLQVYLTVWMLRAGLMETGIAKDNSAAFDLLFTVTNLKAAVVGTILSFGTSFLSLPLGPKKGDPSAV